MNIQGASSGKDFLTKKQELKKAIIGNVFIWSLVFFAGWIEGL